MIRCTTITQTKPHQKFWIYLTYIYMILKLNHNKSSFYWTSRITKKSNFYNFATIWTLHWWKDSNWFIIFHLFIGHQASQCVKITKKVTFFTTLRQFEHWHNNWYKTPSMFPCKYGHKYVVTRNPSPSATTCEAYRREPRCARQHPPVARFARQHPPPPLASLAHPLRCSLRSPTNAPNTNSPEAEVCNGKHSLNWPRYIQWT